MKNASHVSLSSRYESSLPVMGLTSNTDPPAEGSDLRLSYLTQEYAVDIPSRAIVRKIESQTCNGVNIKN